MHSYPVVAEALYSVDRILDSQIVCMPFMLNYRQIRS